MNLIAISAYLTTLGFANGSAETSTAFIELILSITDTTTITMLQQWTVNVQSRQGKLSWQDIADLGSILSINLTVPPFSAQIQGMIDAGILPTTPANLPAPANQFVPQPAFTATTTIQVPVSTDLSFIQNTFISAGFSSTFINVTLAPFLIPSIVPRLKIVAQMVVSQNYSLTWQNVTDIVTVFGGTLQNLSALPTSVSSELTNMVSAGKLPPYNETSSLPPPSSFTTNPNAVSQPSVQQTTSPLSNIQQVQSVNTTGFSGKNGQYPLFYDEPDTNRLARNEQILGTIVPKMEAARLTNVPYANTSIILQDIQADIAQMPTWDQSKISYNAEYPYNKVYESESGHVIEIDDTPNAERINTYHRSGTYTEIDPNGSKTNKIVGDETNQYNNNRQTLIRCDDRITIGGDWDLFVENGANVRIRGTTTHNYGNDFNISILGNANINVSGDYNLKANNINFQTYNGGNISLNANGSGGSGNVSADGQKIFLNSGASTLVSLLDLSSYPRATTDEPDQMVFTVVSRSYTTVHYYDEGQAGAAAFFNTQAQNGQAPVSLVNNANQVSTSTPATGVTVGSNNNIIPVNAQQIQSLSSWPAVLQLTHHAKMGLYTKNGKESIVPQMNLTGAEIATNILYHAQNIYEAVYAEYPAVIVTSGFRRQDHIPPGGARVSQHMYGQAADFFFPSHTRIEAMDICKNLIQTLNFDQFLFETMGTTDPNSTEWWLHISFNPSGNRKQVLSLHNGKVYYQGLALPS